MSISLPISTEQSWTYRHGLNLQGPLSTLSNSKEVIHITRNANINGTNQANHIELPDITWIDNTLLNFDIKYNTLSTETEVKTEFPGGIILSHTPNGVPHWQYFNHNFYTIGESGINFGDGTFHQVSLFYNGGEVKVFEDGALRGSKRHASGTYRMSIGFQILAALVGMDAELKNIKVMSRLD